MSITLPDKLHSWKEIAVFLNCDEKTARRYEKERGMPVRSVPSGKRRTVYADRAELQAWLDSNKPEFPQAQPDTLVPVPSGVSNGPGRRRRTLWPAATFAFLIVAALILAEYEKVTPVRLVGAPVEIDLSIRAQPPLLAAQDAVISRKVYTRNCRCGKFQREVKIHCR